MLRAFADPTRLRLLALLRVAKREGGGEVCVCDLVSVLGLPQPTVSRHLAALRGVGLVLVRKDGAWAHYRLAPAGNSVHRRLLTLLDVAHEGAPQLVDDALKLSRANCC